MAKWIIPLLFLIFSESVADIFAKLWSVKGGILFAALAIGAYIVANAFWLFALKDGSGLWRGSLIFSIASAVIALFLGLFIFQETVTRVQIVGIFFGLISLALIFWE